MKERQEWRWVGSSPGGLERVDSQHSRLENLTKGTTFRYKGERRSDLKDFFVKWEVEYFETIDG